MTDREKKINKLFLDLILGSNYMGSRVQFFVDFIKNYIIKIYDHLVLQWNLIKDRWQKND